MRLQRGAVPALLAAGLLLAAAAGGARAEPPPTTTTTTIPVPGTTTSETTTAAATTTAPTTTAAAATTTAPTITPRRKKTLVRRSRAVAGAVGGATVADRGCFVAAVALVLPGRAPFVLGPVAEAPSALAADLSRLAYPTDGSIVTAGAVDLQEVGCGAAQRAHGTASIEGLSLFRGAVEATAVSTRFTARRQASAIGGLRISGRAARVRAGASAPVGDWGSVSVDTRLRLAGDSRLRASGLSVHLLKPHAGLPAGADVLVAFAALPAPAATQAAAAAGRHRSGPHRRRHRKPRPLTVTPPLGLTGYVFPIAGTASFGDSYGGFRSDVAGNWHHGDDLFAALGTPVVAVASGTLNRVGWESVGGWRLWVRDDLGNEFYYAHLSGYAPNALRSKHVRAGEVIGFVGNSGDAFTTPPHVHFEIHPRRFLHLHYNGAVDPTTYLEHWSRLAHVHAPRPAHPRLPAGAARVEAKYIFRELLAARHLIAHAPPPPLPQSPLSTTPVPAMPVPASAAAQPEPAAARAHGGLAPWELLLVALLVALPLAAAAGPIARAVQRRIVSA